MTEVIVLELPLTGDPNEIIQVHVLVKGVCNQPYLRLIRFLKTKVVVALIHQSLGIPLQAYYTIYMQ